MTRALTCLALIACGPGPRLAGDAAGASPSPDGAAIADASSPDAPAIAPIDASPDAPVFTAIPPGDLTALTLQGACTEVYKGWTLDQFDNCVANDRTGPFQQARPFAIADDGNGGYQITGYALYDSLGERWDEPYTIDISPRQPTAQYFFNPTCELPGECVEHDYTLNPRSLVIATHFLHDNYGSPPPPQCWEYYYDKQDCTFELDW